MQVFPEIKKNLQNTTDILRTTRQASKKPPPRSGRWFFADNVKMFYYRGLREWNNDKGYLTDTCLAAQDEFKKYPDYFRTAY